MEQTANKMITTMATNPQAHYVIADFFKKWADDLERGTVAATDAKLTESLAGTVAGLKSVQATAAASDGTKQLDLRPDMQVVDDSSTNVAAFCLDADPGVNYVAIAYRG
ncbi:hypothetical protein [Terrabacter ginsenosidimutans]|uniref:hypothetical protein n=1 Tax=Terrabacter ginsenosidimutans TaxID=490575 RepID=UPI0031EB7504